MGTQCNRKHGLSRSATYSTWGNMIQRCTNPRVPNFRFYGGRGVQVCEHWRSFGRFLEDMGERPDGMTLDRIDTNGHYEPKNCRWARWSDQVLSRRSTKLDGSKVRQIRWLVEMGYTKASVGRMFGVVASVVSRVASGRRWREVA